MNIYSALADPTRRNILELLSKKGKLPASDIYSRFKVSNPAISQHLKVLRDAELVKVERKAQQRIYEINPAKLLELEGWVTKMTTLWNKRFDRLDFVLKEVNKNESDF